MLRRIIVFIHLVMETRPIFKIVGVGGGASIAVDYMYGEYGKNVSYALIDTSRFIISNAKVPVKLLISPDNRAVVRSDRANSLASQHVAEIGSLFDDGTEVAFIIAGMGGITGTGAAPTVARISKERNIITIGIVTTPFKCEGEKKLAVARKGIEEMARNVDSLIVIDDESLNEGDMERTVLGSFDKSNEAMKSVINDILAICSAKAITCIDFMDVVFAFRNGGHAVVVSGEGTGPNRVIDAIENARKTPLASGYDFASAKRLIIMLYAPGDSGQSFQLKEVELLAEYLSAFPEDMDIIWGLAVDENLRDGMRVTLIASSLPSPYGPGEVIAE